MFGLSPSIVLAIEDDFLNMSLEDLLQVEVFTSSKSHQDILDSPSSVRILTRENIDNLGFSSLEETLNHILGVSSVNGEGNVFTTYTIRGNTLVNFNTNTLLLLDGTPVYNPYHGSFDSASIPLNMIERIEMIPGAQAVLYGSNAVNAVINIISRTPDKTTSSGRIRVGSYNSYLINVQHSQKLETGFIDFFLEANGREGENFNISDEAGTSANYDDTLDISSLALNWRSENVQAKLLKYNSSLPNFRTRSFATRQDNDKDGLLLSLQYQHEITLGSLKFQASYHDWTLDKHFFNQDDNGDINDGSDYHWNYSGTYIDTQLELHSDLNTSHRIISGININRATARRFKEDLNRYDIGSENQPTDSFAAYWNGIVKLNDKNDFHYGLRYTSSTYHSATDRSDFSNTSSRLGWVHHINQNQSLKFLYGEAFRTPTYFEKQVESGKVLGNVNLTPETSESVDIVWIWKNQQWLWEVNPFLMTIHDKITRVDLNLQPSDPDFGKRQNQNIGTVQFSGLEVSGQFRYNHAFNAQFGLGLYDGKNKDTNETLPFTYDSMLNALFSYQINSQWKFNSSVKWLATWGEADSYTNLNISALYHLPKGSFLGEHAWLEISGENLLGENILLPEIARENSNVPTVPERTDQFWFLGLRLEF